MWDVEVRKEAQQCQLLGVGWKASVPGKYGSQVCDPRRGSPSVSLLCVGLMGLFPHPPHLCCLQGQPDCPCLWL